MFLVGGPVPGYDASSLKQHQYEYHQRCWDNRVSMTLIDKNEVSHIVHNSGLYMQTIYPIENNLTGIGVMSQIRKILSLGDSLIT